MSLSRKVLVAEWQKCIGCRICEQWCSLSHSGVINPARARIKVCRDEASGVNIPVICTQCHRAACLEVCPTGAITRQGKTGAMKVDAGLCTLCRRCVQACPNGAVSITPGGETVQICDLCHGRPKCVENCPEGALQYLPVEVSDRLHRFRVVENFREAGGK